MPGAKDERSPLDRGGFLVSAPPYRETTGGGVLVVAALAESLDKPMEWAVGFFLGNTELSLELWTVIARISRVDD